MKNESIINALRHDSRVLFAYLFGSAARGSMGPLSDLDIGVYLDEHVDMFHYRLKIIESITRAVGSERIDVVVLNQSPILLKFAVVRDGIVIKDRKRERVVFESAVLREYLDTSYLRSVQREMQKSQIQGGTYFG